MNLLISLLVFLGTITMIFTFKTKNVEWFVLYTLSASLLFGAAVYLILTD